MSAGYRYQLPVLYNYSVFGFVIFFFLQMLFSCHNKLFFNNNYSIFVLKTIKQMLLAILKEKRKGTTYPISIIILWPLLPI